MKTESFIRWAGGKTWLVDSIGEIIKNLEINNYYEPFLGGASIFLSLNNYNKAYLSDINSDLINTYIQVKKNYKRVLEILESYENSKENYYLVRDIVTEDLVEKAAIFIFLNQTSFNGLYRVNKLGKYNVPYGELKNRLIKIDERIFEVSNKLSNASLKCCDFEYYKYRIKKGDLVFLDPPYTVSHNNNGFIEYNKNLFKLSDQYRLSKFIDHIKKKGAYYILTNAAHPTINEIFNKDGDFKIEVERQSSIGGKNAKRGKVKEYVFTNIRRKPNE